MKVDTSKSIYHEHPEARSEFNRQELRSLRLLLRRLRFLEASVAKNGGLEDGGGNGGGAFAEWEIAALEYVLTEVGFLDEPRPVAEASAGPVSENNSPRGMEP